METTQEVDATETNHLSICHELDMLSFSSLKARGRGISLISFLYLNLFQRYSGRLGGLFRKNTKRREG